ncbi:MAG: hypothetical protein AAGG57_19185 [Pseudomonadota bacterium]
MLSGIGHAVLAFDPTEPIRDRQASREHLAKVPATENIYDQDALQADIVCLKADLAKNESMRSEVRDLADAPDSRIHAIRDVLGDATSNEQRKTLESELREFGETVSAQIRQSTQLFRKADFLRAQIRSAENKLQDPPAGR